MKITQVMLSKGFGGAERYFLDLCLALAANGHTIQAVCHPRFQRRGRLDNCPRIALTPVHAHGSWDKWAAHQIKQHVATFQPALIHAHLARGTWLSGKAATRFDIPLITKTHNYVDLKYYRHVNHFIPTTAAQERFLLKQGIPSRKMTRIPNFSTLAPASTPAAPPAHAPVFTALGRLVRKKGMDVLLRALARYREGGGQAKLRIGGTGPELDRLCRLRRDLKLVQAVEFCGWINNPRDFLSQADMFILPSRQEPFGIVLLEAMALGLPIITTRTHGPLEILGPESACFVNPDDIGALAKTMEEAVTCRQVTRQKAAAALALFKKHYTLQAVLPQILRLYATAQVNA